METIHKSVNGVPKLKGSYFYKCASCLHGKLCAQHVGPYSKVIVSELDEDDPYISSY